MRRAPTRPSTPAGARVAARPMPGRSSLLHPAIRHLHVHPSLAILLRVREREKPARHLRRRSPKSCAWLRVQYRRRCRENPHPAGRLRVSQWWTSPIRAVRSKSAWEPSALSLGQCRQVVFEVAARFGYRVSPEFLQYGFGQYERHHGFGYWSSRDGGAHVRALMDRLGRFTGCDVDGVECTGDGRDGLHGGPNAQYFPVRHASLGTTGAVGAALQFAALIAFNFVVRHGSPALGG